jgi:hypothetical protein
VGFEGVRRADIFIPRRKRTRVLPRAELNGLESKNKMTQL